MKAGLSLALALLALALPVDLVPAYADDLVQRETRVADAIAKYGVTGTGTIVAIMDRGIDWQNNDFRNSDGSTRIAYIFDLLDNTGATAPGNSYRVGTIYTRSEINDALLNGKPLPTRDAVGHGTATAGNCCGNGRNSVNGKYAGIAPHSTLIVVKLVSDGAPAHDGEPAEAAFYDPTLIPVAIDFIRDKAIELGMPCVMILNIGSTTGPADGTSSLSRKIDSTVGPAIPGLVFVTGTGDDGGVPNHAGGTVAVGGDTGLVIHKGSASRLRFELWYQDVDRFDIKIDTPTASYGPYAAPANNSYDTKTSSEFSYNHNGSIYYTNHKRVVYVDMTGPSGIYTIHLLGAQVAAGSFDADLNPANTIVADSINNYFLSYVVPGKTIWDMATAFHNIVPNSYVFRTSYVDIDGIPRSTPPGQGSVGDLWLGSSVGPTWDGRLGMDVSAPGNDVFVTYNPRSWWATRRYNLVQDGGGFYGRAGAVSAANPLVTGIIALMLERNPSLDAAVVKSILQTTAKRDAFTGPEPSSTWGYGKVDALAALDMVAVMGSGTTALALSANKPTFATGDQIQLDLTKANPGPATIVDEYVGALLPSSAGATFGCPSGDAIVFFADGFSRFVTSCLSSAPQTFVALSSNHPLPGGLAATLTRDFFGFSWPPSAPAGTYTFFVAFTKSGTLDVIASAVASVNFTP
jgi:hypothetical protein